MKRISLEIQLVNNLATEQVITHSGITTFYNESLLGGILVRNKLINCEDIEIVLRPSLNHQGIEADFTKSRILHEGSY
jgi:hypothetical protein